MESSLVGILVTPAAAVIGLVCFLVSGGLLVLRRKALSNGWRAALLVLLILSVVYLLFLLWLVIAFGSNPGPAPTPMMP